MLPLRRLLPSRRRGGVLKRPTNIDEYEHWLNNEHGVNVQRAENHYNSNLLQIHAGVDGSGALQSLNDSLGVIDEKYRIKTGYSLLVERSPLKLLDKSFTSFLDKTFRGNVVKNTNWPNPPDGGWLLPNNWFTRIKDIVRCLLVVKYLDGVEFTANEIVGLFEEKGQTCEFDLEARFEGYYAAHLSALFPVSITGEDWVSRPANVSVEIQITTQVQELIRRMLHAYYEKRRTAVPSGDRSSWQWDYKSAEFSASYLGHVLHYVEGMIVEIRDRQDEGNP